MKPRTACLTFGSLVLLLLVSSDGITTEYNVDLVAYEVPGHTTEVMRMSLTAEEYVHIDLELSKTSSVYFIESTHFGWNVPPGEYEYYVPLSALDTDKVDVTGQVPYGGDWCIVFENLDSAPLIVNGSYSASMGPIGSEFWKSPSTIIAILGAAAIVAAAVITIVPRVRLSSEQKRQKRANDTDVAQMGTSSPIPAGKHCSFCGNLCAPEAAMCPRCGRSFQEQ